jgi:hypothetical protein
MSPEFIIEHMLFAGELPAGHTCAFCGMDTESVVVVQTDCSPPADPVPGVIKFALAALLFVFVSPIWFFVLWLGSRQEEAGTVIIHTLPIRVCEPCQPALNNADTIKRCMSKEREYRRLLEKHPYAKVVLMS